VPRPVVVPSAAAAAAPTPFPYPSLASPAAAAIDAESAGGSSGAGGGADDCDKVDSALHGVQMKAMLREFWRAQEAEIDDLEVGAESDYKTHNDLPLARIKRIMKSDEDVRMISAEAPVLFAKACEMFILELTLRAWCYSEQNKRRTLTKEDIQMAIRKTDIFDFLVDVIE
jgi:histone H3/H4